MFRSVSLLSLLLTLVFAQLVYANNAYADSERVKISVQQAHKLASSGEVLLIDIRSLEEWQDTGIAADAIALSMHQPGGIPQFSKELLALLDGDKNKPVALICAGGVRSARAQQYLLKNGFNNVADVTEGMIGGWFTKGWIDQNLPVKPYKKQ